MTSSGGARFLQLNVDKKGTSIGCVQESVERNEFDFYLLQEPFSKKNFWSCPNSLNYELLTSVPPPKKKNDGMTVEVGGDVSFPRAAIVCHRRFNPLLLSKPSCSDMTVIKIQEDGGPALFLVSLYCDSKRCPSYYLSRLPKFVLERCIICTDSNSRSQMWGCDLTDSRGYIFRDFCLEKAMKVVNRQGHGPTYIDNAGRSSRIDITLVSVQLSDMIKNWEVGGKNVFNTFHVPITFDATFISSKARLPVFKHDIKTLDETAFKSLVHSFIDECSFLRPGARLLPTKASIDLAIDKLNSIIIRSFKRNSVKRDVSAFSKHKWWNKDLEFLQKRTKKLFRTWRKYKSAENFDKFKKCEHEYHELKEKRKSDFLKTQLESCDDPYEILRMSKEKPYVVDAMLRNEKGEYFQSSKDNVAHILQGFFPDDDDNSDTPHAQKVRREVTAYFLLSDSTDFPLVTPDEVVKAFGDIAPFKAVPDGIIPFLVKTAIHEVKHTLALIFNSCLKIGYFSVLWKRGFLSVLPKPGKDDYSILKSYRPITLLPVLGKGFEKLLLERLNHHASVGSWFHLAQLGFTKGFSCDVAVLEFVQKVQRAWSRKSAFLAFFLDISGAFDKCWHPLVLKTLIDKGCPRYLVNIINDYLHDRKVTLSSGGVSLSKILTTGCPQGGVLSPFIWKLYINSLLELLERIHGSDDFQGWADDLVVGYEFHYSSSIRFDEFLADVVLPKLELVFQWGRDNKASFNDKTKMVLFQSSHLKKHLPFELFSIDTSVGELKRSTSATHYLVLF